MKHQSTKEHWNEIYSWLETEELGWYEEFPEPSLRLLSICDINKDEQILDIGAGSSTFIDHLIDLGFKNIIAVDISEKALDKLKRRLDNNKGEEAIEKVVRMIIDDITNPIHVQKLRDIAIWHDRAMLHFLLKEKDQSEYLSLLKKIIKKNGYVIIATFSLTGAKKCSGLDVKNYDQNMLAKFLGEDFRLIEYFDYIYHMPSGAARPYIYTLFQKVDPT